MKNRLLKFHSSKTEASLASLLCALLAATSASAQNWIGTGGGVINYLWSDSANWSSPPVSGPTTNLSFSNAGTLNTVNDLGSFSLNTLIQNAAGSLTIYGSSLEMVGANPEISISGVGSQIATPVILSGSGNNTINGADLNLTNGVSGAGKLYINGLVTIRDIAGTWLGGTEISTGATLINNTRIDSDIVNNGTINSQNGYNGFFVGNISGNGNLITRNSTLSGTNSYTGGSIITVGGTVEGQTDSIQGNWQLNDDSTLNIVHSIPSTMSNTVSATISGSGHVNLSGDSQITLTGINSFTGGVYIGSYGFTFGIGSDTAAGIDGAIDFYDSKIKAEGGARTVANPLIFEADYKLEIIGTHNLTFTDTTAKSLVDTAALTHNSSATTAIGGTFLGQNTSQINVNSGTLKLGAAINNGFRMDGEINVAAGATLEMVSNSFVKLGATNLNGGTIVAANGVAIPTGLAINAYGTISGRVASDAGSVIEATGPLSMGDSQSFAGFFSNGELRENAEGVTIMDKNQAVMGSLTTVGLSGVVGTLTAANGMFVDFGRAIEGYGTVASGNTLAQATIINGNAAGFSGTEMLDFSGYVKGVGTFTDVSFSGTFSPGLSPAIVSVGSSGMANSSTLIIEIGGLSPGSQHDQIDIGGIFALAGLLDVDLINGFNPSLGDSFHILDGSTTGSFSGFSLPTIDPGLTWDTSTLYSDGLLKIAAIPEPGTCALVLVGLAVVMRRRRDQGRLLIEG